MIGFMCFALFTILVTLLSYLGILNLEDSFSNSKECFLKKEHYGICGEELVACLGASAVALTLVIILF